jgi:hypothetical protein
MSGYFLVADVGCILSGLLVARLAHRGWRVDDARKLGYLAFSLLAACASLVPFAGDGALMVALLLAAGAGILGLHPYYYAFTQELSARRMGALSGALAAWGWVASSLWQIRMGTLIEQTRSYGLGLVIVGLVPMVGCLALLCFWSGSCGEKLPTDRPKSDPMRDGRPAPVAPLGGTYTLVLPAPRAFRGVGPIHTTRGGPREPLHRPDSKAPGHRTRPCRRRCPGPVRFGGILAAGTVTAIVPGGQVPSARRTGGSHTRGRRHPPPTRQERPTGPPATGLRWLRHRSPGPGAFGSSYPVLDGRPTPPPHLTPPYPTPPPPLPASRRAGCWETSPVRCMTRGSASSCPLPGPASSIR